MLRITHVKAVKICFYNLLIISKLENICRIIRNSQMYFIALLSQFKFCTMTDKSCSSRIRDHYNSEMETMRVFHENCEGNEETGPFNEYGLDLSLVESGTFNDQPEEYIRYQLSWGGPSDEFRYYFNHDGSVHTIEYWFLDWNDGAHITLDGEDFDIMNDIYSMNEFHYSAVACKK
ncbi:hypothetical protein LCGC14_0337500 [marine sediment metagenome]|uniref:Uncharacterized protein n=1 Tax=marine sediment metagenome TaxID=412755 RepID=A0A0F9WMA0_9ZZZZ